MNIEHVESYCAEDFFPYRPRRMTFWFAAVPLILTIGTTAFLLAGPVAQMAKALIASNR